MLVIENVQLKSFELKARTDFVDRMVKYIRDKFPKKFKRFGEKAMRRHASKTLDEAKSHGFETERLIVSYLDLGLLCGRFQDAPWAAQMLDPNSDDPKRRMRQLQDAAFRATGRIHS